ncbi:MULTISPECIES: hypothetical protein [unclassified Caballeronia]|uniref:hypothetical protein n=1 Tax=unclassified Caballeronia TaxID=2646786 RepID=UPI00285468F6|nr:MULTISPECIES: hypothetical protein [unclassified Caballeronia]MDR5752504.1 hypothetical protein [Caballeronia sp. LZ024]MDR5845310.1 hypothetical protein [Caballeronia sp. LZ031]
MIVDEGSPIEGPDNRSVHFSVQLPEGVDLAVAESFQASFEKAARLMFSSPHASREMLARADEIVRLVTHLVEPSDDLLFERQHRAETIRSVFAAGEWLTSEQINSLQQTPPSSKSQPASDWKRRGRIFSVNVNGREYFAGYQFDALCQPLPIIREILTELGPVADMWKIAAWFHAPNGWIAEQSSSSDTPRPVAPKDALDRPDEVLAAARRNRRSFIA